MRYEATAARRQLYKNRATGIPDDVGRPVGAGDEQIATGSAGAALMGIVRAFFSQHPAFLFACFFLVMEYNKLQHVYPVIDVLPWGTVTLLLPFLFAFLDRDSSMPPASAVLPVFAFSFCVIVSILFAFAPDASLEEWQRIASPMLMILLLTAIIRTRRRVFLFVVTYFLVNLKMAQHGFFTWASRGFGFAGWGATGSPVWFQNSGEFAMEMAVFLPIVLALIVGFRREWSPAIRWLFYGIAILAAGSIIASSSRGGLLGLAAVGGWFLIYSRHKLRAVLIVAAIGAAVFAATPAEFKERFATAGEDNTSLSRLLYWEYAVEAFRDNPLAGIGYKNWRAYAQAYYPELEGVTGNPGIEVVHNTILEAASELGAVGLLVYAFIVWQIFRVNRRSSKLAQQRGDKFLAAIAQGTNGGLIAFLVTSFFMSVLFYPVIWMLLVFTVCVATVLKTYEAPIQSHS